VLVVREIAAVPDVEGEMVANEKAGTSKIISFAKWGHPVAEGEDYVEPEWVWPEGTDLQVLDEWTEKVEDAHEKVLGNKPCYCITFIGTDPLYERRGAASLLVQWGIDRCKEDNVPAYLESTTEAGPFYEKHGFEHTDILSMELKGTLEGEKPQVYKEICFLFRPKTNVSEVCIPGEK